MYSYITDWPGKYFPDHGLVHPAIYHMLDVAAVGEELIESFCFDPPLRDAILFLTALHDLGKIGGQFRKMLSSVIANTPPVAQMQGRHWEVTEVLLVHHDNMIQEILGSTSRRRLPLYAATAGHHGKPPYRDSDDCRRTLNAAGDKAIYDSGEVIKAFAKLWPDASLDRLSRENGIALSWWLPGFVTTADWIGSNPDWFPPQPPDLTAEQYLCEARQRAKHAVSTAGLSVARPSTNDLFTFSLRPMQSACARVPLTDGPMLAVIEDETGSGKTEAALILAQRMMLAGKGRGLFFALPTMATADAMFLRACNSIGAMFASQPTLTLAHGRASLSQDFRDLKAHHMTAGDTAGCTDWLADNRRRALLADVGVGTIDQALLGVLPTKFATLRLFALSSKILIVDEVHELGDPYMEVALTQLLRVHAMNGGSAILLTATLPLAQRYRLMAAFQEGVGQGELTFDNDPSYPSLSIAAGASERNFSQTINLRGRVSVRRLDTPGVAVDVLALSAQQGAACVWVRNAVDDAIEAVHMLRARGVAANLLHARFALCDRKAIEMDMLKRFGKQGTDRAGQVLVATQVVESSLDIDFDVMVSDLAPMAALIQRTGRLWRHMTDRPAETRAVKTPVLHVLSPDPESVVDSRWLQRVLTRGAWVYPLALQWRTARVLFDTGQITAPAGLRALIEAAHGEDIAVPEALQNAEEEALGKGYAAANQGRQNVVTLEDGYRRGGAGADDTVYPTRLGTEQNVLMLACWRDGSLIPWAEREDESLARSDAEQLSEVQAAAYRFAGLELPDQLDPAIAMLKSDWPEWKQAAITVCPVDEDGMICAGLSYDSKSGLLFISQLKQG